MAERLQKREGLVITRMFDVPREQVWTAWTEPAQLKKWWGPRGFTSPVSRIDLRVGGMYLNCMRAPDGKDYWSTGVYREVVPPKRLVMTDSFADEEGNVVSGTYYGMGPEFPRELLVILTLEEQEGKTRLTLQHGSVENLNETDAANMEQGWNESFDKLAEYLRTPKNKGEPSRTKKNPTRITAEPAKQEIIITRDFDAPRALVFRAFTDPNLYVQWLGPRGLTTTLEMFEPRNGGSWRYIQTDQDGNEFAFHGVNHEVLPPERIIGTFEFDGLPETGHVILQTARFKELPGNRTKLTSQSVFQSVEDRDGMLQSGMEAGVNDSYERLDELLGKLQNKNVK
jgi:uncharacterized protein YndB with AHSA1/START domain